MAHLTSVLLIAVIGLSLTFGLQNSIIFPGSTRSSIVTKFEDRNGYTDLPSRRPASTSDWKDQNSEGSANRNTVIRAVSGYPGNQANPVPNQNYPYLPGPQNDMKSRKNPTNALSEKGEETRTKLSGLDDLPYDFSKTDKIHRVSDLLRFLGIEEKREDDGGLTVRKSVDDPTQVGCHTEMRTVNLAAELNKKDEEFKLFPQCVKAKRCAGCCGFNSGRVCTPIKKEKVNVYAAVIRVKRSCDDASCSAEIDKDNLRKMFQIDSHEECACKCKMNAEDCNDNQEYDDSNCKCLCKDSDTMRTTCEQNAQKKWSEKNCQCECKKVLACSTGLVFSHKTCSCARKGQ